MSSVKKYSLVVLTFACSILFYVPTYSTGEGCNISLNPNRITESRPPIEVNSRAEIPADYVEFVVDGTSGTFDEYGKFTCAYCKMDKWAIPNRSKRVSCADGCGAAKLEETPVFWLPVYVIKDAWGTLYVDKSMILSAAEIERIKNLDYLACPSCKRDNLVDLNNIKAEDACPSCSTPIQQALDVAIRAQNAASKTRAGGVGRSSQRDLGQNMSPINPHQQANGKSGSTIRAAIWIIGGIVLVGTIGSIIHWASKETAIDGVVESTYWRHTATYQEFVPKRVSNVEFKDRHPSPIQPVMSKNGGDGEPGRIDIQCGRPIVREGPGYNCQPYEFYYDCMLPHPTKKDCRGMTTKSNNNGSGTSTCPPLQVNVPKGCHKTKYKTCHDPETFYICDYTRYVWQDRGSDHKDTYNTRNVSPGKDLPWPKIKDSGNYRTLTSEEYKVQFRYSGKTGEKTFSSENEFRKYDRQGMPITVYESNGFGISKISPRIQITK